MLWLITLIFELSSQKPKRGRSKICLAGNPREGLDRRVAGYKNFRPFRQIATTFRKTTGKTTRMGDAQMPPLIWQPWII